MPRSHLYKPVPPVYCKVCGQLIQRGHEEAANAYKKRKHCSLHINPNCQRAYRRKLMVGNDNAVEHRAVKQAPKKAPLDPFKEVHLTKTQLRDSDSLGWT